VPLITSSFGSAPQRAKVTVPGPFCCKSWLALPVLGASLETRPRRRSACPQFTTHQARMPHMNHHCAPRTAKSSLHYSGRAVCAANLCAATAWPRPTCEAIDKHARGGPVPVPVPAPVHLYNHAQLSSHRPWGASWRRLAAPVAPGDLYFCLISSTRLANSSPRAGGSASATPPSISAS